MLMQWNINNLVLELHVMTSLNFKLSLITFNGSFKFLGAEGKFLLQIMNVLIYSLPSKQIWFRMKIAYKSEQNIVMTGKAAPLK